MAVDNDIGVGIEWYGLHPQLELELVLVLDTSFDPSPASSEHLHLARRLKAGGDQPTIQEETAQHHPRLFCAKQCW